jgi:heme exporter protein B
MGLLFSSKAAAVAAKELRSEFRRRYSLSALLLFLLTTIVFAAFSISGETASPKFASALYWIIMFFAGLAGLEKTFVAEFERSTVLFLKLYCPPSAIYFGKLFYNVIIAIALSLLSVPLFFLFIRSQSCVSPAMFLVVSLLGSCGLATASTIVSAIIARAGSRNALFPILAFPLLLPLLLIASDATQTTFYSAAADDFTENLALIVSYIGIVAPVSYLLFEFVWND